MNLRESIRRIIKEQLSPSVKRRMQDFDLDELVRWAKQLSFNPKNTVDSNVKSTIRKVAVEAFPDEKHFSSEDEHENQWAHFIVVLEHKYYNELTEYFTNKKEEYENRAPEPFIYSLVKHDENGRGFSETFTDMDKLISKFGDWLPKLDWSEVKDMVNKIDYFPKNNFTGTYSSNRMLISKSGNDGNRWGYNFSIIKSVPEKYLDMNTKKLKKNLQESKKDVIKSLIDQSGINVASKLMGGIGNVIKILYDGDIREFSKDTDTPLVYRSKDRLNLYLHDALVDKLGLKSIKDNLRTEKELGDFRYGSKNGLLYKFTARLYPIMVNEQPYYKVVGTSGDSGFGYFFITKRNTLGVRYREQIFNQIIEKYGLDSYMN